MQELYVSVVYSRCIIFVLYSYLIVFNCEFVDHQDILCHHQNLASATPWQQLSSMQMQPSLRIVNRIRCACCLRTAAQQKYLHQEWLGCLRQWETELGSPRHVSEYAAHISASAFVKGTKYSPSTIREPFHPNTETSHWNNSQVRWQVPPADQVSCWGSSPWIQIQFGWLTPDKNCEDHRDSEILN